MALTAENALNFPQRRLDRIGESSNTRGVIVKSAELTGISDYNIYIYILPLYFECYAPNNFVRWAA